MLSHNSLVRSLRPAFFGLGHGQAAMAATRAGFAYENPKLRNKKYKAAAKERRRINRAKRAEANRGPLEKGEEAPPFMIPARYQLIFKYLQAHKNATRL